MKTICFFLLLALLALTGCTVAKVTVALVAAKFYPRQANTNQVNIEQSSKFQ